MFHRIIVEDWQRVLTIISFSIFGLVFLLMLLRVRRLPREEVKRLESLPLANDSDEHSR